MTVLQRLYHLLRARAARGRSDGEERDPPGEPRAGTGPVPPAMGGPLAGYYANLEIPDGADLEVARTAWRRLMKSYHPDRHSRDPERRRLANELAAQLTTAYREIERAMAGKGRG